MRRIVVYPKDLVQLTGKSEKCCRTIISDLKKQLGKEKYQLITIKEIAKHLGLAEEEIEKILK